MLKWLKRFFLGDTQEELEITANVSGPPRTNLELFRAHRQWVKDNAEERPCTMDVAYLILRQRIGEDIFAE